jgi:heat shock protein HspQ
MLEFEDRYWQARDSKVDHCVCQWLTWMPSRPEHDGPFIHLLLHCENRPFRYYICTEKIHEQHDEIENEIIRNPFDLMEPTSTMNTVDARKNLSDIIGTG